MPAKCHLKSLNDTRQYYFVVHRNKGRKLLFEIHNKFQQVHTKIKYSDFIHGTRSDSPTYTFSATGCLYQMGHHTFSGNIVGPMIAVPPPVKKVIFNSSKNILSES